LHYDNYPTLTEIISPNIASLVNFVLNRSWFTAGETILWSTALVINATKYPFLQHCIRSLAYLQHDLQDSRSDEHFLPIWDGHDIGNAWKCRYILQWDFEMHPSVG
jgi:hypothetical protein